MSGVMDATFSSIAIECCSCRQLRPIAHCYCDAAVCETCAPGHLALCAYAKVRRFKTDQTRSRHDRL